MSAAVFTQTPLLGHARLAAANTARDGSGSPTAAFTAAGNGARVNRVVFTSAQATAAANSAMVGRVFLSDAAGANFRLVGEVVIPAVTASNTVIGAQASIIFPFGKVIPSGVVVGVTISIYAGVQDQMDVDVEGGVY